MGAPTSLDVYRAILDKAEKAAKSGADSVVTNLLKRLDEGGELTEAALVNGLARHAVISNANATAQTAKAFYSGLRPSGLPDMPRVAVEGSRLEDIQSLVGATWADLTSGDSTRIASARSLIDGGVQRLVLMPARKAIQTLAGVDPVQPKWARVPRGLKTCAFCTVMASRGFIYATEETAGGVGNEFHAHCHCLIVPSWEKDPHLPGYDPERLLEAYRSNYAFNGDDSVNLSETLSNMRAQPGLVTDGKTTTVPNPEKPKPKRVPRGTDKWVESLPRLSNKETREAAALAVNPKYHSGGGAYQNNCTHCVSTYEMRRKGYAVEATPLPDSHRLPDKIDALGRRYEQWRGRTPDDYLGRWKDPATGERLDHTSLTWVRNHTGLRNLVKAEEPGARFIVQVTWSGKDTGAHVFIAENVGGKMKLIDPQLPSSTPRFRNVRKDHVWAVRVDKLDPTDDLRDFMKEAP